MTTEIVRKRGRELGGTPNSTPSDPSPRPKQRQKPLPPSPFDWLADETLLKIFGYLHQGFELFITREVCRRWRDFTPKHAIEQGVRNLPCKNVTALGIHERIDAALEKFAFYHIERDHLSILEHYLTRKYLSPRFIKILSTYQYLEIFSPPTLRWFHCVKGVPIYWRNLKMLITKRKQALVKWACKDSKCNIVDGFGPNEDEEPFLRRKSDIILCVGIKIIKGRSPVLWRWFRKWGFSNFQEAHGQHSRMALEGARERRDLGRIKIMYAYRALKHNFEPAIADFKPAIERAISLGSEVRMQNVFQGAIKGDDWGVMEMCRRHALNSSEKARDHLGRFFHNFSDTRPMTRAIERCRVFTFIWICRYVPVHLLEVPSREIILSMIKTHGDSCVGLLEFILDFWPSRIRKLYQDEHGRVWRNWGSLRTHLVMKNIRQVMCLLFEKNVISIDRLELRGFLNYRRDHVNGNLVEHKTIAQLAHRAGLEQPSTWDLDADFDTWK